MKPNIKIEFLSDPLNEYMKNEPIVVKQPLIQWPVQAQLFSDFISTYSQRKYNKLSSFYYELLTSAITGGKWRGNKNSSYNDWGFFPDVVTEDSIIDSKGVCGKEKCSLLNFQMHRYLLQQCNKTFMPQEKVRYFIFKYKLRSPSKRFKDIPDHDFNGEVISSLSKETLFLLDLPFSVLYNLHSVNSNYTSAYHGDKWDNGSVILHTGLWKMLLSPEEVLRSVQLNPSDFNLVKTHLPEGMTINGVDIFPFPILKIEDRNYSEWLKQLKENNKERLVQLESEKKTRDQYRKIQKITQSDDSLERMLFHSN